MCLIIGCLLISIQISANNRPLKMVVLHCELLILPEILVFIHFPELTGCKTHLLFK